MTRSGACATALAAMCLIVVVACGGGTLSAPTITLIERLQAYGRVSGVDATGGYPRIDFQDSTGSLTIDVGKSESDAKTILGSAQSAHNGGSRAERIGNVVVVPHGGASDSAIRAALK